MGFNYVDFCSYWRNLTSPLTCWHRGTAFQFDMKDHPQAPVVFTDLGTHVVLVTMATRMVQSIISLGRNVLQKRALYWKIHPRACMKQVFRAVVWVCWSVVDLFLPLLMTTVYVYKDQSRFKDMCNTEQPVNTVTIKCHWGSRTEPAKKMIEELCSIKMETVQEVAKMEVDCKREKMESTEVLLPSCTNPVILSMICMPLDSSEESEVDSIEELEEDCSEEMSVDSGMQESWTPKSKCEEDDEESNWSDEDSWDEESNPSCNEDEDLWASFCHSDDPYNPLSFAMPTRSPEIPKKDTPIKSLETPQILGHLDLTKTECVTVSEKPKRRLCKKPVLSGYKSSHKCTPLKESPDESDQCTKKVRFSPKVTVHPIITWSFAHRMARKGPWEEYARDRSRFQRRIAETEGAISFCLEPRHREKIWSRLQNKQN
ncbi:protein phosphatase 1 regulatory subunit 15A-like [Bufo gargarizans]|uniref:protein phosphatase 1 regulatory subunit 15A-like n=1 Tax=Bufo gargarizans TaxID=30331 RepID=UPI001CF36043|nr:protein phosphatase 1 regulatory subunit 15A-like [Bufo gargarizans]XP_044137615.1 protein phosphatase 1 regulatory subunit 15A-like [Bufo gargarizans]